MILAFGLAILCLALLAVWGLILAGERGHERAYRWRMGIRELQGFFVHPGLFYHPGHTWIMPEANGTVRVGLDDFGRRLVDGVRRVGLPERGSQLTRGKVAVQLDCGKKHADLLSPVDGVVTAINDALSEEGAALERDPYGKGWLFTAKVSNQAFRGLPTGSAAMDWLRREVGRLSVFFNEELGMTAADGGELIRKPPRMLSDDQWEHLVKAFFCTGNGNGDGAPGRLSEGVSP